MLLCCSAALLLCCSAALAIMNFCIVIVNPIFTQIYSIILLHYTTKWNLPQRKIDICEIFSIMQKIPTL